MNVVKRAKSLDQKTVDDILDGVAHGLPLTKILDDKHISYASWYQLLETHDETQKLYARAKQDCADRLADQIIEIAEQKPEYVSQSRGDDVTETHIDAGWVNWQRTRIDAKKWIAAKLKPKSYGDKQEVEHSGSLSIGITFAEVVVPTASKQDA